MLRFWSKVKFTGNLNGCWSWNGGINSTGRGIFWYKGKSIHAHRMAWILFNGPIPKKRLVLHHCDNGRCVNPDHFFLGTQKDNIHDMIKKGRQRTLRGDNDPKSKLTSNQVKKIRRKWKPYIYSQQKLADEYGVSRSAIQAVLDGRNWRHL